MDERELEGRFSMTEMSIFSVENQDIWPETAGAEKMHLIEVMLKMTGLQRIALDAEQDERKKLKDKFRTSGITFSARDKARN